jgi:hypothetical protein
LADWNRLHIFVKQIRKTFFERLNW